MAWSAVLDFENSHHPLADRRREIMCWAKRAAVNVTISEQLSLRAKELTEVGFGPLDAAHLACAEAAACDCFLTCDDRLIRKAQQLELKPRVLNPIDYLKEPTNA